MESILADRIVSLSWRLKRADLIQNQTIDAMNEKNTSDPLANLAKSFGLKGLALPQPQTSDPPSDLTLGRIALKDFSNARVLDRLLMYERRIEHSLYKTTLELQRLHLLRTLEPSEPNLEPEDRRLSPGPVPGVSTEPNNTPEPGQNHPTSTILERSRNRNAVEIPCCWDPLGGASSIEYRASRIQHHCAKQTQCQNGQDEHKHRGSKALCQQTTNNEQRTLLKTNPNKANFCISSPVHRV
jgi:hypothetical protein